jgi:hypothetical protein
MKERLILYVKTFLLPTVRLYYHHLIYCIHHPIPDKQKPTRAEICTQLAADVTTSCYHFYSTAQGIVIHL